MSGHTLLRSLAPACLLALWTGATAAVAPGPSQAPPPPAPRAPAVPLRLPAPVVYQRVVGADSAVTFGHEIHVELAGYRCLGCHPQPFRMLEPTRRISHADMESGGSCGLCHDGRSAFAVREPSACQTCHAGTAKPLLTPAPAGGPAAAAAARSLPRPVPFTRGEASPGTVRFRHEPHLRDGTACRACHPKPYRMAATGGVAGGAMHEAASCGGCHDGRRAFGVEDPERCARCHAEAGP